MCVCVCVCVCVERESARELLGRAVAADKRHGKVSPNSFRYV